jgi:hypothetical protein
MFYLLTLLCLVVVRADCQTVKVTKERSTVKGEAMEGYAVELEGSLAEVNTSFMRFLKTIGKVKQSEVIVVNEPNLNGLGYTQPVFGVTNENGKTATAWLGFHSPSFSKQDAEKLTKELEKVMKDFGVKFYRDKIQAQIDESMRATQAVEKQQQRLQYENRMLGNKIEDNKKEKVRLEKSIENNKQEYENLLIRIEQNKKAQDSVATAAEQIRKVVEAQREKQRKVN